MRPLGYSAIGRFSKFPPARAVSIPVIPQIGQPRVLREVRNDFGKPDYGGPCPPKGHGTHHYHSRLLAISRATLDLRPTASAADVLKTAEPYAIRRAELVGTYQR